MYCEIVKFHQHQYNVHMLILSFLEGDKLKYWNTYCQRDSQEPHRLSKKLHGARESKKSQSNRNERFKNWDWIIQFNSLKGYDLSPLRESLQDTWQNKHSPILPIRANFPVLQSLKKQIMCLSSHCWQGHKTYFNSRITSTLHSEIWQIDSNWCLQNHLNLDINAIKYENSFSFTVQNKFVVNLRHWTTWNSN